MNSFGFPILYTLFLWWFSTGAIVFLDGLNRRTFIWSMSAASLLFGFSLWGIANSSSDISAGGAYAAFGFGILAWGWQLVSFYMGFVTGPRVTPCEASFKGLQHFLEAAKTSLYHELAVCLSALFLLALTWGKPNQMGVWTFAVLWWMHMSAKLNIYFGVPNLGEELLPEHLRYLRSFMSKKPMNLFFPISVSVSTVITVLLAQKALAFEATPFETTSYTILATLMALAILEHWFLVTPLEVNGIWLWNNSTGHRSAHTDDHAANLAASFQAEANLIGEIKSFREDPSKLQGVRHISHGKLMDHGKLKAILDAPAAS